MAAPAKPVDPEVLRQIAMMSSLGTPISEICRQLNLTRFLVNRYLSRPDVQDIIRNSSEEALKEARTIVKSKMAKLAHEVTRVIEAKLGKDDLEAVKISLKILGMEENKPEQGDTTIHVTLPGQKQVKDVSTEFRTVDEVEEDDTRS